MSGIKQIIKRPVLVILNQLGRMLNKSFDKPVDMGSVKNILVIQLGGIGDVLRLFPLFQILSREFPNALITSLTEQGNDLFKLLEVPNSNCRHQRIDFNKGYLYKLSQIISLRKNSYDLIIVPSRGDGIIECSVFAFLLGAPYRVGFIMDGSGFLHTNKVKFRKDASIVEQNLELLKCLGIESEAVHLSIRIPDAESAYAEDLLQKYAPNGELPVFLHPWAISHPEFRSWPSENYIELTRYILSNHKSRVFLLGSSSERRFSEKFELLANHSGLINITGVTSLLQTAALIKKSALFIGNDSGLLHIANALKAPSIGIFGATSPIQILSPGNNCIPIVSGCKNLPCRPCYVHQPLFTYRCNVDYKCLKSISVEEVIQVVKHKLNSSYSQT